MSDARPSIKSVQRTLIVGVLVGLILGCAIGAGLVGLYIQQNPPVYAGGAYPNELTQNYQDHYIAMVIDSYQVNRQLNLAQERLKTFDPATKVNALGKWSVAYTTNGQATEAQAVNELAANLRAAENWSPDVIAAEVGQLASEFQGDSARLQAVNAFGANLNVVPQEAAQPAGQTTAAPTAPPAESGGGFPWRWVLACLLLLVLLVAAVLLLGRWQQNRTKSKKPVQPVWEGEGPAPIKRWTGTYTLGQDNYDEFFTIETDNGDFLGESGMGIMETIPGSSPKQVTAFDVGLFDKTDITTLSRVVMSEHAYNDPAMRAKIEANPQAEAILAEPGKKFTLETSAMRVEAKVDEMEYGPGGNVYFNKLKLSLSVFVKEGADLKIGTMDIPDQYR
ncbi:MAG: hypothetical protein BroJett011_66100 [Chloroflexota bacterium]|nr:MAG: hypothetical protein BroJett011_66100 [Chloroflexota bacterium]